MRYRVEAAGGTMNVVSAPGSGTLIEAWLPALPEPVEA
jgi:signal transduction histidine kinase